MIGMIMQARMGSTRLPGKVLKPIGGRPLLQYILDRLEKVNADIQLVIATSKNPLDDKIKDFCSEHGVCCYRGSEENVLERYYFCARDMCFSHIVRLTADNPFVDPEEIDCLIDVHIRKENDFTYSFSELPVGVGAEIFSAAALEDVYRRSYMPHHFEHVDEYLLENMEKYQVGVLEVPQGKRKPEIRLTVDTPLDYQKACFIADAENGNFVSTERAIALCMEYVLNPHIKEEWGTFTEV